MACLCGPDHGDPFRIRAISPPGPVRMRCAPAARRPPRQLQPSLIEHHQVVGDPLRSATTWRRTNGQAILGHRRHERPHEVVPCERIEGWLAARQDEHLGSLGERDREGESRAGAPDSCRTLRARGCRGRQPGLDTSWSRVRFRFPPGAACRLPTGGRTAARPEQRSRSCSARRPTLASRRRAR